MNKSDERNEKVKNWLKQPLNLALLGVFAFAFFIRMFYFNLTKLQPLWWDEAAYGMLAKNFISHAWDASDIVIGELTIRPPFFPLIWSYLLRIGLDEIGVRFILEFVPSVLAVLFVYLIGKELYDQKIGIISAAIFAPLWIHLFYSSRLLTDVPALVFILAGMFFFLKSTKNKFVPKLFVVSLILTSIGTLFRYPHGLIFFVYAAFILLTGKIVLLKDKKFWITGIAGLVPMWIFFLVNYVKTGNIFPALLGGGYAEAVSQSFAFNILSFIPLYLKAIFFIFFLVGLAVSLFEIFLGYDQLKTHERIKSHLFNILSIVIIYSYFIFKIRGAEDRWLMILGFSFVSLSALGIDYAYGFVKKYNKNIAVIGLIVVVLFGMYSQVIFGKDVIDQRRESFSQMREGFEWIEANTPPDAVILGQGIEVYSLYYSGRMYEKLKPIGNTSEFEPVKAQYLVLHAFVPQDQLQGYLKNNYDKWEAINAFFFDKEQKQAALIIYKAK